MTLNQFLAHQGLNKKGLAESIGWTQNSLSQALRLSKSSPTFMEKFQSSGAFPGWTIGYDFESGEYVFKNEQPSLGAFPGGYDLREWPKSFFLTENDFVGNRPHIYCCLAACPVDAFAVYEDGRYVHFLHPTTVQEFAAFPVADLIEVVELLRDEEE